MGCRLAITLLFLKVKQDKKIQFQLCWNKGFTQHRGSRNPKPAWRFCPRSLHSPYKGCRPRSLPVSQKLPAITARNAGFGRSIKRPRSRAWIRAADAALEVSLSSLGGFYFLLPLLPTSFFHSYCFLFLLHFFFSLSSLLFILIIILWRLSLYYYYHYHC